MRTPSAFFLALLAVCAASSSSSADAADLKVDVYEGPKQCDESERISEGKHVKMYYAGTIDESSTAGEKGQQFERARPGGPTFGFEVGKGRVIKGLDRGLLGLCKGSKATLIVPPALGYGPSGHGAHVPADATLKYDVQIVDVADDATLTHEHRQPPMPNVFKVIDADGDGQLTYEEVWKYFESKAGTMRMSADDFFEMEDRDGDGLISWEEFGGLKGTSRDEL